MHKEMEVTIRDEQYSSSDFDANNNLDEVNLRNENIFPSHEVSHPDGSNSSGLDAEDKTFRNKSHSHKYIKEFLESQRGSRTPLQNFIKKKLSRKCCEKTNLTLNQFHSLPDMHNSVKPNKSEVVEKRFIINIGKYFDIKTDTSVETGQKGEKTIAEIMPVADYGKFLETKTQSSLTDIKGKLYDEGKPMNKVQLAKLLFEPKLNNKSKRISPLIKKTCSYFEKPETATRAYSNTKLKKLPVKSRSFGTADFSSCKRSNVHVRQKKPGRDSKTFNDAELPNPDKVRRTRQFFEQSCKKGRSFPSLCSAGEQIYETSEAEEHPQYVSEDILSKIREYGTTTTYYGGCIVDQYLGQPVLTKAIMDEIEEEKKRFPDRPVKCNPEKGQRKKKLGRKFRLIKYNSCDSRIELLSMNCPSFELERVRIHPK
ncbi:uncharacterized protein LOC132695483 [Cylas formicarius]|uniref:uncharacterized protein LOC132695483 n=1 Tax=Cylas formicarius TaxID=197179 RepID=UPI0029583B2F|nr:uncharacterized protein LOC132695483 [Cylas formicarius]